MQHALEHTMKRVFVALSLAAFAFAGAACKEDPQVAKKRYLQSGDQFIAKQNYAEAIIQYRNAVVKDGSSGEARFKLADAYEKTGDQRNALREFVRAADLMPDNVEAQLRAGKLLIVAGQFPEAKARAMTALAKDPKNVNALLVMGNSLAGMKDVDGAISQLEDAIESEPKVTFTYANLGLLQLKKGDRSAA